MTSSTHWMRWQSFTQPKGVCEPMLVKMIGNTILLGSLLITAAQQAQATTTNRPELKQFLPTRAC
ncbi:MAG: hypothetical protein RQ714_06665 [Nitrosomonas sp.]|nr:hypothetical protein [Nitrosomonas sp.]